MPLPCSVPFVRSWPFALTLSLLLHASLVLPCLVFSSTGNLRAPGILMPTDTRVPMSGTEIHLLVYEPHRPTNSRDRSAETSSFVGPEATGLVVAEEQPVPAPLLRQAVGEQDTTA